METIYKIIARISSFRYRRARGLMPECRPLIAKSLVIAIEDAKEFLGISTDDFFDLANSWIEKEQILFDSKDSVHSFYQSWKGDFGKSNICANILNQHIDHRNFQVVRKFFSKDNNLNQSLIDYGCGTGSLTLAFAIESMIQAKTMLLDVDNDITEFIKFRIVKHQLQDIVKFENVGFFSQKGIAGGLYCIDVLEHVENSTALLIDNIHPLLALNGILYLKAPWRGQLTHLDEAADNFYKEGGRAFLNKHYELLYRAGSEDICCVYRKVKQ